MLTRRFPHTPSERGFTLVELLVGMVLFVVVIAGAVYGITKLSSGNDDVTSTRMAQRQAVEAMEQLRSDVAAVRSPGFQQWDGRRESLRDVVRFGTVSAGSGALVPAREACAGAAGGFIGCFNDITSASASEVWMRADVLSTSVGTECVGYVATSTALTRYVAPSPAWRNCGPGAAGGATATQLISGQSIPTRPFTYTLRYNPVMRQGKEADPDKCVTVSGAASLGRVGTALARNLISSIDIDLTGITTQRNGASSVGLRSSMPITSHTAGDYAFAVGCSY